MLANIKLLNRVVSLLGTGFYILLLIMVTTIFHIFLVFKSCSCNVLASFDINFVSPLCILFLKFPSLVSVLLVLLLFWNWDNWRAGHHSTHAEAKSPFLTIYLQFRLSQYQNLTESCLKLHTMTKICLKDKSENKRYSQKVIKDTFWKLKLALVKWKLTIDKDLSERWIQKWKINSKSDKKHILKVKVGISKVKVDNRCPPEGKVTWSCCFQSRSC